MSLQQPTKLQAVLPFFLGVAVGALLCMSVCECGLFAKATKAEPQPAAVVVDTDGNVLQDLRPFLGSEATAAVYGPFTVIGGFVGLLLVVYLFTLAREKLQAANLRATLLRR